MYIFNHDINKKLIHIITNSGTRCCFMILLHDEIDETVEYLN